MKRFYLAALAASLAGVVTASSVSAGTETGPKVALHVSANTTKSSALCTTWTPLAQGIPCSNYVTEGALATDQLVYMVVAQADTPSFQGGIAGVNFGIDYNGIDGTGLDVIAWVLCADGQQYPNSGPRGEFPESGGGNLVTWFTCQESRVGTDAIHAVIGVFQVYAYTDDIMRVTPNRNLQSGSTFALANCSAQEIPGLDSLRALGQAGFGTKPGCNSCTSVEPCPIMVPVEPATWGKIKTLFGR